MRLRSKHILLLAAPAILTVLSSAAQEQKPAPTETKPAQAKPVAAATAEVGVSVPVAGLTKETSAKVTSALQELKLTVYVCPGCKASKASKGTCEGCKKELAAESKPALSSATADAESGMIRLRVAPGAMVRLSEIERALKASNVTVSADKLSLAGGQLVVKAGGADSGPAVEKALKDAKLVDNAQARFDPTSQELLVTVRAGATAPTRQAVAAAIEKAGSGWKLTDVIWTGAAS